SAFRPCTQTGSPCLTCMLWQPWPPKRYATGEAMEHRGGSCLSTSASWLKNVSVTESGGCDPVLQGSSHGPTHALRGAVKVFLRLFRTLLRNFGHGDRGPGDRRIHRTGCAPANTDREYGSI